MGLLKEVSQKYEKTVVQVTHSAEYAGYGTKVINIKDGVIQPGAFGES